MELQNILGQIVEDEVVVDLFATMLDNLRLPSQIIAGLCDVIGDVPASYVVNWAWDRMKQIKLDPSLQNVKEFTWEDLEESIRAPLEKFQGGGEVNFAAENRDLKKNVIPLVRGPIALPAPGPDEKNYPSLIVTQALLDWHAIKFTENPEETLFFKNAEFREYFLDTLYLVGFMLSSLVGDEGCDESSGEIAEIGDTEEPEKEEDEENSEEREDPATFVEPLAEIVPEIVILLVKGCTRVLENSGSGEGELLYQKYKNMAAGEGDESDNQTPTQIAVEAVSRATPPFAEVLGRTARGRQLLRSHPDYSACVLLGNKSHPDLHMLYNLTSVLEEEILVIHAGEKKGYRVSISGCSDNKLLGMALAATLIQSDAKEPELLQGQRPPVPILNLLAGKGPQALPRYQYAHPFTFSIWSCVKPDGTAPSGMVGASHWIWPEGTPSQIPQWHESESSKVRVLLLNKVPFARKFTPVRMFDQLEATAKIEKTLSTEEVEKILKDIGASSAEARQKAMDEHKKWKM